MKSFLLHPQSAQVPNYSNWILILHVQADFMIIGKEVSSYTYTNWVLLCPHSRSNHNIELTHYGLSLQPSHCQWAVLYNYPFPCIVGAQKVKRSARCVSLQRNLKLQSCMDLQGHCAIRGGSADLKLNKSCIFMQVLGILMHKIMIAGWLKKTTTRKSHQQWVAVLIVRFKQISKKLGSYHYKLTLIKALMWQWSLQPLKTELKRWNRSNTKVFHKVVTYVSMTTKLTCNTCWGVWGMG